MIPARRDVAGMRSSKAALLVQEQAKRGWVTCHRSLKAATRATVTSLKTEEWTSSGYDGRHRAGLIVQRMLGQRHIPNRVEVLTLELVHRTTLEAPHDEQ